jgi:two-component system sensor histidine kinase KdpD
VGYPAAALLVALTVAGLKLYPGLADSTAACSSAGGLSLRMGVAERAGRARGGARHAAFNFFFLPPVYTFTIEDPRNVTALVVFLASGLLIGRLSALARRRLAEVEAERRDLTALTQLSQAFSPTRTERRSSGSPSTASGDR